MSMTYINITWKGEEINPRRPARPFSDPQGSPIYTVNAHCDGMHARYRARRGPFVPGIIAQLHGLVCARLLSCITPCVHTFACLSLRSA